jgi:hypothetical protein
LNDDVKQKLEFYVESLPVDQFDDLDFLLEHTELSKSATKRLNKATMAELDEPLFFHLPKQVGDRIVSLFINSNSFGQANSFSTTVTKYAADFNKEQVEKIIKSCGNNYEIKNSFEVGTVINALRRNKSVSDEEIDSWLTEVSLKKYIKAKPEDEDS